MNLGQAVAVCLYEIVRGTTSASATEKKAYASADQVERLTTAVLDSLHISGYVKQRTASSTEEKVRRLVRRMALDEPDAEVWLGMLRQILWKLRSAPHSE